MFLSTVVPETWSLITPFIDELYDHGLAHETTAKLFTGHNIEGLKAVQKSHWELTFKNGFDTSYEERAYRIGHSHAKIRLAPNIFTDSYGFMMERLVQRILASGMLTKHSVCADKMQEITHVIFRDLSRVLDIYYQVLEERRVEARNMFWTSRANFRTACRLCRMMCNLLPQPLIRWTVRSAIFPRTWTKAQTTRVPRLSVLTVRQSQCSRLQPLRKRSDYSCRSSRKSQTKENFWPSTRQSKPPARARRAKGSPWLPTKYLNWLKAPKAVPAMWQ